MKCPVCNYDLSDLDIVSRHEHVELCCENGPSMLVATETGQLVVKSTLPQAKQRKICPVCCKTFHSLHTHYKTCALKNDLNPSLMLEQWDRINLESNSNKKFPRDLLDKYIAKCVKEGRIGEQVDFARALLLSMTESDPTTSTAQSNNVITPQLISECSNDATGNTGQPSILESNHSSSSRPPSNGVALIMQNATHHQPMVDQSKGRQKSKPKYRIELVDSPVKESNIQLRIDRELAATRIRRYQEALVALGTDERDVLSSLREDDPVVETLLPVPEDDDCCVILDDKSDCRTTNIANEDTKHEVAIDFEKLFYKSRLKRCNSLGSCPALSCSDKSHELELTIEGFHKFTLPLDMNEDHSAPEKVGVVEDDVLESIDEND